MTIHVDGTVIAVITALGILASNLAQLVLALRGQKVINQVHANTNSTLERLSARADLAVSQKATAVELAARPTPPPAPPAA
jgi:uncharacterized membrane protein